METHSSILAWRIPWIEEPRRLQSMGSQSRKRLSDSTKTYLEETERIIIMYYITYYNSRDMYWRRQWHPTPVLLPGKSHGQRSLVGCSPWGR